jgi:hypothetical protein
MSQFEVRFFRGEDPTSSSWLVTEVLSDDGEGNRTSDIRAEFDPTPRWLGTGSRPGCGAEPRNRTRNLRRIWLTINARSVIINT